MVNLQLKTIRVLLMDLNDTKIEYLKRYISTKQNYKYRRFYIGVEFPVSNCCDYQTTIRGYGLTIPELIKVYRNSSRGVRTNILHKYRSYDMSVKNKYKSIIKFNKLYCECYRCLRMK